MIIIILFVIRGTHPFLSLDALNRYSANAQRYERRNHSIMKKKCRQSPTAKQRAVYFQYVKARHRLEGFSYAEPVWRKSRTSSSRVSKIAWVSNPVESSFSLRQKNNRHCQVGQFALNAHWAEPSPMLAHRARPSPLNCENEYVLLALVEETTVQEVVGSIVWTFRTLKKPVSREMNDRGYALQRMPPTSLSFRTSGGGRRDYTFSLKRFFAKNKRFSREKSFLIQKTVRSISCIMS